MTEQQIEAGTKAMVAELNAESQRQLADKPPHPLFTGDTAADNAFFDAEGDVLFRDVFLAVLAFVRQEAEQRYGLDANYGEASIPLNSLLAFLSPPSETP